MYPIEAKVILHSRYEGHPDLLTLALTYPRYIHAEFLTHRVFSRNASSSRAIPVAKMLKNVSENPVMPISWGSNKPGMQAGEELEGWRLAVAKATWKMAAKTACFYSWILNEVGLHKQHANRGTEPYQLISVLVTSTEWSNFMDLRNHPDAQPEIQYLAQKMLQAMSESQPQILRQGDWHLPFIRKEEFGMYPLRDLQEASAARCARVSYLTHQGRLPEVAQDKILFQKLAGSTPIHASPLEHIAVPSWKNNANLVGWKQFRKVVEDELYS